MNQGYHNLLETYVAATGIQKKPKHNIPSGYMVSMYQHKKEDTKDCTLTGYMISMYRRWRHEPEAARPLAREPNTP